MKKILNWLDKKLYNFLLKRKEIMPQRFRKMVVYFYTDARVRKQYWQLLNVEMGEGTYANIGMIVTTSDKSTVKIGNHCSIAPYVTFITDSNANNGNLINKIEYVKSTITKSKDIIVEDEVWIGANVTILPGVRIGKCSVIGAGSVVTEDVESYSIYAGSPAKKIRKLECEKKV